MPEARRERVEGEQSGLSPAIRSAIQGIGIFLLAQLAIKQFTGGGFFSSAPDASTPAAGAPIPAFSARPESVGAQVAYSGIPQMIAPIWSPETEVDISAYISPSLVMPALDKMPSESLIIDEKTFPIGLSKDKREIDTTFPVPKEVQSNGTLWAHFYVAVSGYPLDPTAPNYDISKAYHFFRPLNQYIPKKKVAKTRHLLSHEETSEPEEPQSKTKTIASYYHPNFTISVIPDSGNLNYPAVHPSIRQFLQLEATGARDSSGQNGWYYPIVYLNTFWQLRDHMTEINSTTKRLPIRITLDHLRNFQFSIYASIDDSIKANQKQAASGAKMPGGGDGSEFEELKRVLVDTNVYLLGTTAVVTILHTVFEMLAFKSDISHFRNKKDNVGISTRSILANVFMQTVIFLYLMDNNDNTSWMILFGQGMGILLEAWKITKVVDVRLRPAPAGSYLPYHVIFEDKHKLSETEKKTQEYDQIAFKYLYMIAVPLLGAYAVYSVMYDTHKSWYSFVITTLVGSVYAYGFLMMVPSLYINYRLKSVAHMPARAMTYKFLNTFIDDLFAFTIKMPTLHRLATLRDDVIFFVYIYQSWAYKVDYTRVNEFGQGGDEEEVTEKLANKPLSAPAGGKTETPSVQAVSGREEQGGRKRK